MYRKLPHERLAMLDAAIEELGKVSEHLSEDCSGSVATCITPDYHEAKLSLNGQIRSQRTNEMEVEDENDFAAKIEEKLGKFAADLYKDIKKSCVTEQDREVIEN